MKYKIPSFFCTAETHFALAPKILYATPSSILTLLVLPIPFLARRPLPSQSLFRMTSYISRDMTSATLIEENHKQLKQPFDILDFVVFELPSSWGD